MERRLRLRDDADFQRLRTHGRAWGNRLLTLQVLANTLPQNRYGFVISKRVGNAVTRNLIKRRLREIFRQLDRSGQIAAGHDLVVIVRPAAASALFATLVESITLLLVRATLLRPAAALPDAAAE